MKTPHLPVSADLQNITTIMTPVEATDLVIYNQTINDVSISGIINFSTDNLNHKIDFQNCQINNFQAGNIEFIKKVSFVNCTFKHCDFSSAYFIGGLDIVNCTFNDYLDFQCSGHNKTENPIRIQNSTFKGFVNFFDCMYEGPFILTENDFQKGSNLLGNKNQPYEVTFKIPPTINNNKGALDLNIEG